MVDVLIGDGTEEVHAQVSIKTEGATDVDWTGLTSLKLRLNLGSADELHLNLPARQDDDGEWRPDMPVWQVGGTLVIGMGYDNDVQVIQKFEIVSTSTNYPEKGAAMMTVRGVSDLARAARNKEPRTFDSGSDSSILAELCAEYGWSNGIEEELADPARRLKEAGTSDLEFLKLIATEARLGAPRLNFDGGGGTLMMPTPEATNAMTFTRGSPTDSPNWRRLHQFKPNREGGMTNTKVSVTSFDPGLGEFVEKVFELDAFGGDPTLVYEGPVATQGIQSESTTGGMTLSVVEQRGYGKKERHDVLASGRYKDEASAEDLARRWFELREKLSRYCTAKVDGHYDLWPYQAVILEGNMAAVDKGYWLPLMVEHQLSTGGWLTSLKSIRIVEEPVMTPAT